jgi:hypothetical protein
VKAAARQALVPFTLGALLLTYVAIALAVTR